ncbi:MAG: ArsB/NhaD family transporter [Thermacetogeniaceae bacterium]|jgi:Na+/H+ antiporter NhaD/arsenite permease-like protein
MHIQANAALAVFIFLIAYFFIITRKQSEAVVALAGSLILILLGVVKQPEAIASIDFNTLGLLVGMMIVVDIARHSGLFGYIGVWSARITRAEPVLILLVLAGVTALLSAFLSSIAAVLLIVPVGLSLAESLEINPVPFLFAAIITSNIGGTATLIGDPSHVIIGTATGLSFTEFIKNLGPIVLLIFAVTSVLFWIIWRNSFRVSEEARSRVLALELKDQIADRGLLIKSLVVFGLMLIGFFFSRQLHLDTATIALVGAIILIIAGQESIEESLLNVDWPTILFILGFFVMVGALTSTGAIHLFAQWSVKLTGNNVAILTMMVLWFSAIVSAFVNNIPFVTAMVPFVKGIGAMTGIPLVTLWWALALGGVLGGNGTIIGATANIIVAGVARRNGYPITYLDYMKIAFPVMVLSIILSSLYLFAVYLR